MGDKPNKIDDRVQQYLKEANALETQASEARSAGQHSIANELLQQALAKIQQGGQLADDLQKIVPLQKPLQAMLHNNKQWNTECGAIRERLASLQKTYLTIRNEIASGVPAQAWQTISGLQVSLVQLIDDNQKSYEVRDLFRQFDGLTVGMDPELAARNEYQRIRNSRATTEREYFQKGLWAEARAAILSDQNALQGFLQQNEDAAKKATRMAANADLLNEQLATNQAQQQQLGEMASQLEAKQAELDKLNQKNSDILISAAQDRTLREKAAKDLEDVRSQLNAMQTTMMLRI